MPKYNQGRFRPQNPQKYSGDPANIVYRSGWELVLMRYLDKHPKVIKWGSEEVVIPYKSPIDGRWHRYFIDFNVQQINTAGEKETILIEVKPKAQTRPPTKKMTKTGRPTKRFLKEVQTWGINESKWKAAQEYCKDRNWKFQIFTEDQLGI